MSKVPLSPVIRDLLTLSTKEPEPGEGGRSWNQNKGITRITVEEMLTASNHIYGPNPPFSKTSASKTIIEGEVIWPSDEELDITKYQAESSFTEVKYKMVEDLKARFAKYIPPEGAPPFFRVGFVYRRNSCNTPEWRVNSLGQTFNINSPPQSVTAIIGPSATMGSGGPWHGPVSYNALSRYVPGDLVLAMSNPSLEEPYQQVLSLTRQTVERIYVVEGMMAYWDELAGDSESPEIPGTSR